MNWLLVLLLLAYSGNGCCSGNGSGGNGNNGNGNCGGREEDDRNGILSGKGFPWQDYPDFGRSNDDCDCDKRD